MPLFAGQAHPSSSENSPFNERTIRIHGEEKDLVLTFAYPKPDDIVDWTTNGHYDASNTFGVPLTLVFEYRGHFWQGVFGNVIFDVKINTRRPDSMPWKDMDSLLLGVHSQQISHNKKTEGDHSESRQEWLDPFLSELNGAPCIQQYVKWGDDVKKEKVTYFSFDENHAIEIHVRLVDNSNRPGLTQSDWRPRAEAFASKLLSTVKVHLEPAG